MAFDQNAGAFVGSGGIGTLKSAMIAQDLAGGTFTAVATDSGLLLTGPVFDRFCECGSINTPNDLVVQTSGDITLDATFSYANDGTGDIVLATSANFINGAADSAFLLSGGGRWLVYSTRPDQNSGDIATLGEAFITYGTAFNLADPQPASLPAGNGLIYSVTPVVTVGPAAMVYGGTLIAPPVTVTVGGATVLAADFGIDAGTGRIDPGQVSLSGDGFVNAGIYAAGLTTDITPADFAPVTGVTLVAGALTVDAATLVVTLADQTRTYDGTAGYTGLISFAGFVGSDTAGLITAGPVLTFAGGPDAVGKNVGSYVVSAGGMAESSGNYVFDVSDGATLQIDPAALTVAITGNPEKTYDATTDALLTPANFLLTGFAAGEGAVVTQTFGTYASKDVSTTDAVTAALGAGDFAANAGTLLANYVLPARAVGNGIIDAATLTISVIGTPTKTYDGTDLATLTAANFLVTGFVGGEGTTVTQTAGNYATKDAVTPNLVTVGLAPADFVGTGATLMSNYTLPILATGNGTINPAVLTAAVIGNPAKTYDGGKVATLTAANYLLTGFVTGEGALVTQTVGTYASKDASAADPVTVALGGGDFAATGTTVLSNYVLPTLAVGNGVIIQAVLSAGIIGNPSKPFDGTTTATLTAGNFILGGFVAGEGASITQTAGTYASSAVGTGIAVTATLAPGDFVATGTTLLANYVLPATATGPGSIGAQPTTPVEFPLTRGLGDFATTPLGDPTGPADDLQLIDTETTQRILDEINAGSAFCKQLLHQEYMIDCLSDRLQSVADGLSAVGEYSDVRRALEDAAQKLHALAVANASADLAQQVARAAGRSSSRPLTAVSMAGLAGANAQATAIINSAELVLLRSSSGSERRRVAFQQVAQVVDSTKVLLRSS